MLKRIGLLLFIMFALVLSGCSSGKNVVDDTNTKESSSKKIDVKLLEGGDNKLSNKNEAKLPENNMYAAIKLENKVLKVPAAWKDNWDYVINNCRNDLCDKFNQLGSQYVNLCKNEVSKKCKKKEKDNRNNTKTEGSSKKIETKKEKQEKMLDNKQDCTKIDKYEEKLSCYMAKVYENPEKPKKCIEVIPKQEKKILQECIKSKVIDVMIKKNDIKICDKLKSNVEFYNQCKDVYYDYNAMKKKDKSLCKKITDKKMREMCMKRNIK